MRAKGHYFKALPNSADTVQAMEKMRIADLAIRQGGFHENLFG